MIVRLWDNLTSQSRDENNRKHQHSFLMSLYQKAHWNVCTSAKYCVKNQNIITIKIPALIADCLWLFWHNITSFNLAKWSQRSSFNTSQHTGESQLNIYSPLVSESILLYGCSEGVFWFLRRTPCVFVFPIMSARPSRLFLLASWNFKGDFLVSQHSPLVFSSHSPLPATYFTVPPINIINDSWIHICWGEVSMLAPSWKYNSRCHIWLWKIVSACTLASLSGMIQTAY